MSNDEIRKLLGGYATNTLTDAERKSLFDAALNDQELFNALQDEEALKDLLADPVTRAQLRGALEEPVRRRTAWWKQRWTWAGAVSAVAAAVLIVSVVRMNSPSAKLRPPVERVDAVRTAAPQPSVADKEQAPQAASPKPSVVSKDSRGESLPRASLARSDLKAPPPVAVERREEKKAETVADASPVAPPPPPAPREVAQQSLGQNQVAQGPGGPSQNTVQMESTNSFVSPAVRARDQLLENAEASSRNRQTQGLLGGAASANIAPVRYAVLRRDRTGAFVPIPASEGLKSGDEIKLSVTPVLPGLLTLEHLDGSGAPARMFPATGAGLAVAANTSYTIPDSPIEVSEADQRFRLILSPQVAQAGQAERIPAFENTPKAKAAAPAKPLLKQAPPPFIDITIGPKHTP